MEKEALLICDMLNDFVLKGAPLEVPQTRKALRAIKREIRRARKKGFPVIYICDSHDPQDKEFSKFGWPAHGVRGTKGAEVVEELRPLPDDIVVAKKTYAAFHGTVLDRVLKKLGVTSIRITGCVTHICVLFTAYDGVLRDYKVTVVQDGVAGITKKDHDAALRIMKNVLGVTLV